MQEYFPSSSVLLLPLFYSICSYFLIHEIMKKRNTVSLRIRELKKDIKGKVSKEIHKRYTDALQDGKYPWEGTWLTIHEIRSAQKRLKKRDRIVFTELMVLFIVLVLFSIMFYYSVADFMPNTNASGVQNTRNAAVVEYFRAVEEKTGSPLYEQMHKKSADNTLFESPGAN